MNTKTNIILLSVLALGLAGPVPRLLADADRDAAIAKAETAAKNAPDLAAKAKDKADDAGKAAEDAGDKINIMAKKAEDELNAAIKKREDVKNNPDPDADTQKLKLESAEKAVKNAEGPADFQKEHAGNPDNVKAYRDALAAKRIADNERDHALDDLKKAIKELNRILNLPAEQSATAVGGSSAAYNKPLKDALEKAKTALADAQKKLGLAMAIPAQGGSNFAALLNSGQVTCTIAGTGEVIGTVANLTVQNLTDQPLNCSVQPTILESISGKNQPYACPKGQTVALGPHEAKTVPINGVCLNRNKPPVGKGVTGDLVMNTGDPNVPQNPGSHIPAKQARDLLRICTAINEAAEKLQKDGALKDIPYRDPQEKIKIAEQWSTWCNPRISEITGAPPATKEDLRKVVYKQLEAKGPMTPETKKKVDQGINAIFEEGVKLTTDEAKNHEKPAPAETTGGPGEGGNNQPLGTANVSDEREGVPSAQGTPPQTQTAPTAQPSASGSPPEEKKTEQKPATDESNLPPDWYKHQHPSLMVAPDAWKQQPAPPKTKEKDPAVQNWLDKYKDTFFFDGHEEEKRHLYEDALHKFFENSKHHGELEKQRDDAKGRAGAPGATQKDKDNYDKAKKELVKLEGKLEADFNKTKDGEKLFDDKLKAEKAADEAHKAEQKAGKDIDQATKDAAEEKWHKLGW